MVLRNKRAAMEMSVGTIVTIVLLMSVLVLGLVLIQKIFGGATDSVEAINADVLTKINDLYGDDDQPIIIALGADNVAKIKDNTENFGVGIIFNSINGETIEDSSFRYTVSLDDESTDNCLNTLGPPATKALFAKSLDKALSLDQINGRVGGARIALNIPKGTAKCSQVVRVTAEQDGQSLGLASFTLQII